MVKAFLGFRVTPEEQKAIEAAAKECEETVAVYVSKAVEMRMKTDDIPFLQRRRAILQSELATIEQRLALLEKEG